MAKRIRDTEDLVTRLRKIEGQVRGVQRMLAEDADCVDVLTQISAVVSGMDKVALRLLGDHMRGCVADAVGSKDRGRGKVDEAIKAAERFLAR